MLGDDYIYSKILCDGHWLILPITNSWNLAQFSQQKQMTNNAGYIYSVQFSKFNKYITN